MAKATRRPGFLRAGGLLGGLITLDALARPDRPIRRRFLASTSSRQPSDTPFGSWAGEVVRVGIGTDGPVFPATRHPPPSDTPRPHRPESPLLDPTIGEPVPDPAAQRVHHVLVRVLRIRRSIEPGAARPPRTRIILEC